VKIAISARGPSSDSDVDERFGRAYWFLIYDEEDDSWMPVDNSVNRAMAKGAGQATAEMIIGLGVAHVLTGETGPKAYRVLSQAGIPICHGMCGMVRDAFDSWRNDQLEPARAANDNGSPSCLLAGTESKTKLGEIFKLMRLPGKKWAEN
jgi:predicted Fe-Mo cluster-binding NifX family protein